MSASVTDIGCFWTAQKKRAAAVISLFETHPITQKSDFKENECESHNLRVHPWRKVHWLTSWVRRWVWWKLWGPSNSEFFLIKLNQFWEYLGKRRAASCLTFDKWDFHVYFRNKSLSTYLQSISSYHGNPRKVQARVCSILTFIFTGTPFVGVIP